MWGQRPVHVHIREKTIIHFFWFLLCVHELQWEETRCAQTHAGEEKYESLLSHANSW